MWRHVQCGEVPASESLHLMRQHSLYLETGGQLIRFTFYSQLNSSPAPEAQTEAIMKCQWSGSRSLQTADYLDHGMGQLVKVSKRLEHWQIMYTVTLLPAWPRPM